MLTPRKRRRLDAMAELLRADVADQVRGAVGVAIDVAIEAGDAAAGPSRLRRSSVCVELLLGKRGDQQPEPFELLGVEDAVE